MNCGIFNQWKLYCSEDKLSLYTETGTEFSKHTVTPKKPDTTSYNIVHLYKIQKQAKLVCDGRDQNDGCLRGRGLALGTS